MGAIRTEVLVTHTTKFCMARFRIDVTSEDELLDEIALEQFHDVFAPLDISWVLGWKIPYALDPKRVEFEDHSELSRGERW